MKIMNVMQTVSRFGPAAIIKWKRQMEPAAIPLGPSGIKAVVAGKVY
jgi:hypothetical protein